MENEALHTHDLKKTIVPPTCKSTGYTLYTCECGYEYKTEFQPMGAHNFEIAETTPATCVEPGRARRVCATCGESYEQVLAPLGHTYGEWAIQAYPTCTESGKKVCKCGRCATALEEIIPPRGHQCRPGTERRINGKVVDYFCSNCGQTIIGAPPVELAETSGAGGAAPRIVLALAALATLVQFFLMILTQIFVDNVSFTYFPLSCASSIFAIGWYMVLAVKADKLKGNPCYTKWMSIGMLKIVAVNAIFAMLYFFSRIDRWSVLESIKATTEIYWTTIIYLLLAILFLSGMEKKIWVLIVVLVFAALDCFTSVQSFVLLIDRGFSMSMLIYSIYRLVGIFVGILTWAGFVLLILPAKKPKLQ